MVTPAPKVTLTPTMATTMAATLTTTLATNSPLVTPGGHSINTFVKSSSPFSSSSSSFSPFSLSSSTSSSPSPSPFLKPVDFVYHSWSQSLDPATANSVTTTNASNNTNKSLDRHQPLTSRRQQAPHKPLIMINRNSSGCDVKGTCVTPFAKLAFLTSIPEPLRNLNHTLFDKHRVFSPTIILDKKFDWSEPEVDLQDRGQSSLSNFSHPSILQSLSLPNGTINVSPDLDKVRQQDPSSKCQKGRGETSDKEDSPPIEIQVTNISRGSSFQPQKGLQNDDIQFAVVVEENLLLAGSERKDQPMTNLGPMAVTRLSSTPNPPTFKAPVSRLIYQRQQRLVKNTKQSSSSPILASPLKNNDPITNGRVKKERRRHLTDESLLDNLKEDTHDSTKSIPEIVESHAYRKNFAKKSKGGIRRLFMPLSRSQSTGNGGDARDGIDKLGRQKFSDDHNLADVILSPEIKKRSLKDDIKSKINVLTKRYTNLNLMPCEKQTVPSVKMWARSFEDLLADKTGLECFRQFLKSEFSEENLQFWLACEELKKLKPHQIGGQSQKIFHEFIAHKAPHEVNIDARTREITCVNMGTPSYNTFDEAQKRVQALMERDSYLRFIESDFYQNLSKIQFK